MSPKDNVPANARDKRTAIPRPKVQKAQANGHLHDNKWQRLTDRANQFDVLTYLERHHGISYPRGYPTKGRCPWDNEHMDFGAAPACRYYPSTNSLYCFDTHGLITTTTLVARSLDIPHKHAVDRILREHGIGKQTWRERYRDVDREATERRNTISPQALVEAIHIASQSFPGAPRTLTSDEYTAEFQRQLDRLDAALSWANEHNLVYNHETMARLWVNETKRTLEEVCQMLAGGPA
jgi:hypothetical protein